MISKKFQEQKGSYAQKVNRIITLSRQQVNNDEKEWYDYTSYCYKKRMDIAVNGIDEMKKQLRDVCEESEIEALFAFSNTLIMCGGYNGAVDSANVVAEGAAIWILDQLTLQKNLEKCYPYLSAVDVEKPAHIAPYINHPMYDFQLILSVVHLICQRNTAKTFSLHEKGMIMWPAKEPEQNETALENRRKFDAVMKLLDKQAVTGAVERYREDVWRFYRLAFRAYMCVQKRIEELEAELKSVGAMPKELSAMPKVLAMRPDIPLPPIQNNVTMDRNRLSREEMLQREIDMLEDITFTQLSLVNDREKTLKKLKGIVPNKLAEELIHFHVRDPYESAFALLWLLDTQDDLPWFYYGSISVAYTMQDQLSVDTHVSEFGDPVLLSKMNDALYEHKYKGYRWNDVKDVHDEPVQREYGKNLSQVIFESAMAVFPRVVPGVASIDTYLESLGELTEREKEAYTLLLHTLHAQMLRAQTLDEYLLENQAEEPDSPPPELLETTDNTALIDELQRLRSKNNRLTEALRDNLAQKRKDQRRVSVLEETVVQQSKELADLREKVFLSTQEQPEDIPEDTTIQYPYRFEKKILSFGGHVSWINEMKKRLPTVVFVSPDSRPNVDMIRGADEVWIQTNCIGHKDYYRIMETLKGTRQQVHYFVYGGANKCAEQLVKTSGTDKPTGV